jgi:hypothetical protein
MLAFLAAWTASPTTKKLYVFGKARTTYKMKTTARREGGKKGLCSLAAAFEYISRGFFSFPCF